MTITQRELTLAEEIVLAKAREHFPPTVEFKEAHASVMLDIDEEEMIRVHLIYKASHPVLDGDLMYSMHDTIDGPLQDAGITAWTMVQYSDFNDPTWQQHRQGQAPTWPAA